MNKMNPVTPMAPIAIKNTINPAESPKTDEGTVLVKTETSVNKKIATVPTTATIGKITDIKLAINPNFLPDSSDTL